MWKWCFDFSDVTMSQKTTAALDSVTGLAHPCFNLIRLDETLMISTGTFYNLCDTSTQRG